MTTFNYRCSQQELYTAARLGWNSNQQHLAAFADFKAKYTQALIDSNLQAIDDAQNLPDEQARGSKSETERILLKQKADIALNLWQNLKRYIADAFPPELQKTNYDAAGQSYYEKAAGDNWESAQGLLTAGFTYLSENTAILQANQNMPANFVAKYSLAKTEFDTLHQAFLNSTEDSRQRTEEKIEANNAVYSALISMFLDGQEIFKLEETIKKQFIFEQVLLLMSGGGVAGVKGNVTIENTLVKLAGVTVVIVELERSKTTDQDGRFEMLQVAGNTYTIKFDLEGYETKVIENYEIKTGIVSTLNVALKPFA